MRFGLDWFAAFCARHGTDVIVVNGDTLSPEQEVVQNLLAIVQVFSERLYGLRSSKKLIQEAVRKADDTQQQQHPQSPEYSPPHPAAPDS
jgi:predicted site-specific integrase-resolvase